jgi:prepilin-type N-terminal cleavage/methylation domain-containing protein/prepilin-type processing-associated H-X9-DG protein
MQAGTNNMINEPTANRSRRPAGRPDRARAARAGFTLVELLVVIAIVAVLLSLLSSAMVRARERTELVTCLNNLRTLGIAFNMYRFEHDDKLPPYEWDEPGAESQLPALRGGDIGYHISSADLTYCDALLRGGYVGPGAWDCPTNPGPPPNYGWGGLWTHSTVHDFWYTDSHSLGDEYAPDDPFPYFHITHPSRSFHLMDKVWDGHGVWPWDQHGIHAVDGTQFMLFYGTMVNAGKRSVLFFDGHVDARPERGWSVYHHENRGGGMGSDGDVFWYQVANRGMPVMDGWSSLW